MTPSEDRDLAICRAKFLTERAAMHLEHGRYSVAQDCLRSAAGWLELDDSQSRLPNPSPADTIPAGTGQPVADLPAGSNSIDVESLAAWRESQGQPIDAEPRAAA